MEKMKWADAQKELNSETVFLEFYTTWCPDCKMMEPVVAKAESEIKAQNLNVKFIAVDAEEANLFRSSEGMFNVLKVPAFFVIKDSVKTHIGFEYLPVEKLVSAIKA